MQERGNDQGMKRMYIICKLTLLSSELGSKTPTPSAATRNITETGCEGENESIRREVKKIKSSWKRDEVKVRRNSRTQDYLFSCEEIVEVIV